MAIPTIDTNTLRELLDRQASLTVLDVRHAADWAEWNIPGSLNADVYDALKAKDPNALARGKDP